MDPLKPFEIAISSLKQGLHSYNFEVDNSLLKHFDQKFEEAQFRCDLELDKRSNLIDLHFSITGKIKTDCDRCMESIFLPLESENSLVVKYDEEERQEEDIIYLDPNATSINVGPIIYECIMLSMPLRKVKDCKSENYKDCNQKILDYLDNQEIEEEEKEKTDNPLASALKDINITFNKK